MLVEGVEYEIAWERFFPGTSLFFPCLDGERAKREISPVLKRLGLRVITQVRVENGVRGLRVWRK